MARHLEYTARDGGGFGALVGRRLIVLSVPLRSSAQALEARLRHPEERLGHGLRESLNDVGAKIR